MCWRNKRIFPLYEWKRNENDVYEFNATILWFFYPKQMKHQISDRLHTDLAKLSTVKMKVWWQGSHLRQSAGKVKASKYCPVDHTVLVQPRHNQLNKAEYEKTKKILDGTFLPTLGRKSVQFYISLLTTCVSLTVVDRFVDKWSANTWNRV